MDRERKIAFPKVHITGRKRRGALLLALCLSYTGLWACAQTGSVQSAPELLEPVGAVQDTAVVKREDCYRLAVYDAQVIPGSREAEYPQNGIVAEIRVQIGEKVQKGQVILKLDESALKERIDSLRRQLSQQRQEHTLQNTIAGLQEKQAELELKDLREKGDEEGAGQKVMELEALRLKNRQERESRGLSIEETEGLLSEAEKTYGTAEVKAPCDGTVTFLAESAKVGGTGRKGMTAAYVSDNSQALVLCPELGIAEAQSAERITGDDGKKDYVLSYAPYTTEESVSMALAGIKIMSRLSGEELPPVGTYMNVFVKAAVKENVITIPVNALFRDSTGSYVYCIQEDGSQNRREIRIGLESETTIEVLEGLEEGEVVYVKS